MVVSQTQTAPEQDQFQDAADFEMGMWQKFQDLDKNGNGSIEFEEIKNFIMECLGLTGCSAHVSTEVQKAFEEMDRNHDGVLDFQEFVHWHNRFVDLKHGKPFFTTASREERPAAVRHGISLHGLRKLLLLIKQHTFLQDPEDASSAIIPFEEVTTTEVVHQYVIPLTKAQGHCRFVELEEYLSPEEVGEPQYFVSHAWRGRFSVLLTKVFDFLQDADDITRVWLDCFAVNQHYKEQPEQNQADVSAFEDVVRVSKSGTLVVVDDLSKCNPAKRGWCIYEWDSTFTINGNEALHMPLTQDERLQLVKDIDVAQAECYFAHDKEMILKRVEEHYGSLAVFDSNLKRRLLFDPLQYSADVEQLIARQQGNSYGMQAVLDWLDSSKRAMCIVGLPGTGKSTLSAGITDCLEHEWARTRSEPVVLLKHFLKYNDVRRLEPMRIITSLASQLAEALPEVEDHMFTDRAMQAAMGTDVEEATQLLLETPLRSYSGPKTKVVLVIDALDEADPPEQLLPNFKGNVKACGNKCLQLLRSQLVPLCALPNVDLRFFVTTRPEAVLNQAEQVVSGLFDHSVVFKRPEELQHDQGDSKQPGKRGVLVHHTVVGQCMKGATPAWAVKEEPTLRDVYAVYDHLFRERLHNADDSSIDEQACRLLEVLLAAQEPISEALLQQMGFDERMLRRLPGCGTLFFTREHHVYMLHKSLFDWLSTTQQRGLEGGWLDLDVRQGHCTLGLHLANVRKAPRPYCLKWSTQHLSHSAGMEGAIEALEHVLLDWDFLLKTLRAGYVSKMLEALGGIPEYLHSPVTYNTMRWLRLVRHDLDRKDVDERTMAALAVRCSPLTTPVHLKGVELGAGRCIHSFGSNGYVNGTAWAPTWAVMKGHTEPVTSVAYSPDGTQVASASYDRTVKVWDVASGECRATLQGHTGGVNSVAYSPDGTQVASASDDMTAKVWDLASGECRATVQGHTGWVMSVAYSPDGTQVASASRDETVKVWDLASGECRATLQGHTGWVNSVAYSPDGTQVASASADMTAKVWDLASGEVPGHAAGAHRLGQERGVQPGRDPGGQRQL